jgi:hypothetical protein
VQDRLGTSETTAMLYVVAILIRYSYPCQCVFGVQATKTSKHMPRFI